VGGQSYPGAIVSGSAAAGWRHGRRQRTPPWTSCRARRLGI